MAEAQPLPSLLPVLRDLVSWWEQRDIAGYAIGGLADALLATPRLTQDVDAVVLVPEAGWDELLEVGQHFGFDPRIPEALAFARQSRFLLLRHRVTGISLALILGALPFEYEGWQRRRIVVVEGIRLPLCTPEDLLVMKIVAHRSRDLEDVRSLIQAEPDLDWPYVARWVAAFDEMLATDELSSILVRVREDGR